MEITVVLWALISLVVGLALGGFAAMRWGPGAVDRRETERLRNQVEQLRAQTDDARAAEAQAREEAAGALGRARVLEEAHAQREAQREEHQDEENQVLRALAPMTTQLHQLGLTVNHLEKQRSSRDATLEEQLRALMSHDQKLLDTTSQLAGALKDTTQRGSWGEVQLRRVVELAGMTRHVDFAEQVSIPASAEGTGGRPDMVIHLPGEALIAVDAKAPLPDAEHLEDQAQLGAAAAKALDGRIGELGKRSYAASLPGSPNVVVCFVPAESMLSRALEANPALLEKAFAQNVVLASPSTLLAILKGLAVSWRQEQLTANAAALYREAQDLHGRLGRVLGLAETHGKRLNASVESYNQFVASVTSRLLPSLRRIEELDPAVGTSEPEPHMDSVTTTARPTPEVGD